MKKTIQIIQVIHFLLPFISIENNNQRLENEYRITISFQYHNIKYWIQTNKYD